MRHCKMKNLQNSHVTLYVAPIPGLVVMCRSCALMRQIPGSTIFVLILADGAIDSYLGTASNVIKHGRANMATGTTNKATSLLGQVCCGVFFIIIPSKAESPHHYDAIAVLARSSFQMSINVGWSFLSGICDVASTPPMMRVPFVIDAVHCSFSSLSCADNNDGCAMLEILASPDSA